MSFAKNMFGLMIIAGIGLGVHVMATGDSLGMGHVTDVIYYGTGQNDGW